MTVPRGSRPGAGSQGIGSERHVRRPPPPRRRRARAREAFWRAVAAPRDPGRVRSHRPGESRAGRHRLRPRPTVPASETAWTRDPADSVARVGLSGEGSRRSSTEPIGHGGGGRLRRLRRAFRRARMEQRVHRQESREDDGARGVKRPGPPDGTPPLLGAAASLVIAWVECTVPVLPSRASDNDSARVTSTSWPPASTNRIAASILGPMLPGGNCPSARRRPARSARRSPASSVWVGLPKSFSTRSTPVRMMKRLAERDAASIEAA